jgi:putative ABC transport system permease protein
LIRFLLKGLLRDRSRSLIPTIIVAVGVFLTVFLYSWLSGIIEMLVHDTAVFSSGHVKIMTRAYYKEIDQVPNDLALTGAAAILENARREFPSMTWTARIRFGGLLDVPDSAGETRVQGPVAGMGVDLFSPGSPEPRILKLQKSIARGRMPAKPGEILVSEAFAVRLGLNSGDTATLIGSTMNGGMATANFIVAGTVRFGITALDHGAMIADIGDVRQALDMADAAGEILGFFGDLIYRRTDAEQIAARFNAADAGTGDQFSPEMVEFRESSGLASYLDLAEYFSSILVIIFVGAMSIVLWNAGLMGSLRRYGEIGVRLAVGEDKGHIYRSMLAESIMVGLAGSVVGTALGLALSYYLQAKGINIGSWTQNASILIQETVRARVTPTSYYLGIIPGFCATLLGTSLSGIGIYKRQTSQLAKEMES